MCGAVLLGLMWGRYGDRLEQQDLRVLPALTVPMVQMAIPGLRDHRVPRVLRAQLVPPVLLVLPARKALLVQQAPKAQQGLKAPTARTAATELLARKGLRVRKV